MLQNQIYGGYKVQPTDYYGLSYYSTPSYPQFLGQPAPANGLRNLILIAGLVVVGSIVMASFKQPRTRRNPRRNPKGRGYGKKAKYFHLRVKAPGKFQKGSFRTIDPGKPGGAKIVIGRLKGKKTTTAQSILVPKAWVGMHDEGYMKDLEKRLEKRPAGTASKLAKRVNRRSKHLGMMIRTRTAN